jgi:hypothetical protein
MPNFYKKISANYCANIYKYQSFAYLIGFFALLTLSISRIPRWDLLDHIAMADRFRAGGGFYADIGDMEKTGASCYFPGSSLLALAFTCIFPENVDVILMYLLACSVTIFGMVVISKISQDLCGAQYIGDAVLFTLGMFGLVLVDFLAYASELKPDLLSFSIGAFGLYLSGVTKNVRVPAVRYILSAVVTGSAVAFKQQQVFFVAGMVVHSILFGSLRFRIFTLMVSVVAGCVLAVFFKSDHIWYNTFFLLTDDGFLSINQWLALHKRLLFKIVLILFPFTILCVFVGKQNQFKLGKLKSSPYSPWLMICLCVAFGAALSSFKNGGNAGNTEFGIAVLIPFLYVFVTSMFRCDDRIQRCVNGLIVFGIIAQSFRVINFSVSQFSEINALNCAVANLKVGSGARILSGSNVYYASRTIKTDRLISNYWAMANDLNLEPIAYLPTALKLGKYQYIVVESWPENIACLKTNKSYNIVYLNSIGIVAKQNDYR